MVVEAGVHEMKGIEHSKNIMNMTILKVKPGKSVWIIILNKTNQAIRHIWVVKELAHKSSRPRSISKVNQNKAKTKLS